MPPTNFGIITLFLREACAAGRGMLASRSGCRVEWRFYPAAVAVAQWRGGRRCSMRGAFCGVRLGVGGYGGAA